MRCWKLGAGADGGAGAGVAAAAGAAALLRLGSQPFPFVSDFGHTPLLRYRRLFL